MADDGDSGAGGGGGSCCFSKKESREVIVRSVALAFGDLVKLKIVIAQKMAVTTIISFLAEGGIRINRVYE